MADLIHAILLSLTVLLVPFCFYFLFHKSKKQVDRKLPPGQSGRPVIGETIEFLSSGWKGHPEKFIYDRMAKFSPHVFRTSLLLEDVAVFCGSAGNKFSFSNENKLVQGWFPGSLVKIFTFSSTESKEKRKMVRTFFTSEALHQFVPVMDMMARRHFETEWKGMDQIVTHEVTKKYTFLLHKV
nr:beta-amyrin 28-oxidase-like [Tanacetum cinerariifolium]